MSVLFSEGSKSFTFNSDLPDEEKKAIYEISGAKPVIERVPTERDPNIMSTECFIEIEVDSNEYKNDSPIKIIVDEQAIY